MKPKSYSIYRHLGNQIYKTTKRTRLIKKKRSANCWRNRIRSASLPKATN
ncbi:hypothetical protein Hanom_Chr02g00105981 [Helianthus anomalus]